MDKLQEILNYYKDNLQDKEIELYAGRKGQLIHLALDFNSDHLKHLMGLHKLKDKSYWADDSSSRLLKKIQNGELTLDRVSRSSQFPLIESRLECIFKIKDVITKAQQISKSNDGKFLNIDADYMLSYKDERLGNIHLFLKENGKNRVVPVSIFNCYHDNYLKVQCPKWTVLSKDKVEQQNKSRQENTTEELKKSAKRQLSMQEQVADISERSKIVSEASQILEKRQVEHVEQVRQAEQVRQVQQVGQVRQAQNRQSKKTKIRTK